MAAMIPLLVTSSCEVMISSLAKVMGLQSGLFMDPFFHRHQEHSSIHLKSQST